MFKFFEKLYVGTQEAAEFSTVDYPLAFATPYGTDAAFRKRKETVDCWSGSRRYFSEEPEYEGKVIENVPLEGFRLSSVEQRYVTSNKLFRLQDPRGITLEISAENMLDLAMTGVVSNGLIEGKCLWGRSGGQNWLTRETDPVYLEYLNPTRKSSTKGVAAEPNLGDRVSLYQKGVCVYLGKRYIVQYYYEGKFDNPYPRHGETPTHYELQVNRPEYPLYCFEGKIWTNNDCVYMFRNPPKFGFLEETEKRSFPDEILAEGSAVHSWYTTHVFDTKEEADAFVIPPRVEE